MAYMILSILPGYDKLPILLFCFAGSRSITVWRKLSGETCGGQYESGAEFGYQCRSADSIENRRR